MGKILIQGGTVVNEGKVFRADILIQDEVIEAIFDPCAEPLPENTEIYDATGMYVIPGVIDDQVHFREPGLTRKGDMHEGSRAAAAGGITSFMDMPNVSPPTTTLELLEDKQQLGSKHALINYSFYLGATTDNLDEIRQINPATTCGVKVFMGSSTGNMLVDNIEVLERIFATSPVLIATHCEDNAIIERNLAHYHSEYGDDIPPWCHPLIRSRECCYASSSLAVKLARKHHTRLHILHLSTMEEPELLEQGDRKKKQITGEACVHHLWFNDQAYLHLGNKVKWNPAIKTEADRQGLLNALKEGYIDVVATDHAPHLAEEKKGIYTKAASGGPMVQHSLPLMLELVEKGELSLPLVVDKMCHAPADIFRIEKRGYLRKGYKADIALLKKEPWEVTQKNLLYKCGWSPLEGMKLSHKVIATFVNGHKVYERGMFDESYRGELLRFNN